MARKAGLIGNNRTLAAWGRDDLALGPTAWNCHLHPSLRFSGSSNHLIHAFLAVASLGNLCPPKLLHLGTQHSVPRLFLFRLSMPPTATHQQDNSYGGSAIWRVSKFVKPLIDGSTDRCGIAIVTNQRALSSGSDQPERKLGRLRILCVRRENKLAKTATFAQWYMVHCIIGNGYKLNNNKDKTD